MVLSLVSCSTSVPSPLPTPGPRNDSPVQPPPVVGVDIPDAPSPPEPPSGKSSVSGVAYSYTVKRFVPGTLFYLTPASSDNQVPPLLVGPEPASGDIQGETGSQGEFVLNDVPPGDYYFVIWAPPYSWSIGEESPTNPTPRLIRLGPDDKVSLGTVYLGWP
jgi:hypothetical protein